MKRPIILIVCLVAGSAVTPTASPACDQDSSAVREARAVATGIIAADNARAIERVLQFYAADAILMPPGERIVTGHEAIRPRYEELFRNFDPEIEARADEACAGDGVAFVRGHNGGRLVPRQGGETRKLDDDYLMLLRRDKDGAWRITHLMWHRAGPPAAAPVK